MLMERCKMKFTKLNNKFFNIDDVYGVTGAVIIAHSHFCSIIVFFYTFKTLSTLFKGRISNYVIFLREQYSV